MRRGRGSGVMDRARKWRGWEWQVIARAWERGRLGTRVVGMWMRMRMRMREEGRRGGRGRRVGMGICQLTCTFDEGKRGV